MLTSFDWLRRSRSGAELLATLECLTTAPDLLAGELGLPHSALAGPCRRCWVYARRPGKGYCHFCQTVLAKAGRLGSVSRQAVLAWGYVNQLPRQLQQREGFYEQHALGIYIRDERRFLLALYRRELKTWLQELILYHGADLKGLIQIFPTMGVGPELSMADVLGRVIQRETNFSPDRLRVQFYAAPYQVMKVSLREQQDRLTFEVDEFLRLLELATVFRMVLRPEEQQALYKLLNLDDLAEALFYWGRFLGYLSQEAKDMLNAWKIRQWPHSQVELLYELVEYVEFYSAA